MKKNLVTHSGFKPADRATVVIHDVIDALVKLKLLPKAAIVLSVSNVSSSKMKSLNKKHRGKDKPTDVLSFEQDFTNSPRGTMFLGDLVICMTVAKKQAKEHGHPIRTEFTILLTHGILHLLGFDHEKTAKDAKKMALIEKKVLAKLIASTPGLIDRTTRVKQSA